MPENPIPATKSESGASPDELNFAKPPEENPRIKRRSLKTRQAAAKPAPGKPPEAPQAAAPKPVNGAAAPIRELQREAPPRAAEPVKPAASKPPMEASPAVSPAKIAEPPQAPPRVTPPAAAKPFQPTTGSTSAPTPKIASTVSPSNSTSGVSPHGTRPATLYYSSHPRKDKEDSPLMKSTPAVSPASPSSSTPVTATSVSRPAASPSRGANPVDYRANVERQAREQKSVGSVLAYAVYSLIALFVLGGFLAGYGAYVLSRQIHDQSLTVSDLDQRYSAANKDLSAKLTNTQETLDEARAQLNREQEVILKQQDAINRLTADTNANASALRLDKEERAQETANLRARLRELDYKINNVAASIPTTTTQK